MDQLFPLAVDFATSFVPVRSAFEQSLSIVMSDPSSLLAVADDEGVIGGYVLAFMHETFFANGPVCWIEELMVRSDARRGGTGRLLVVEVEAWAAGRGAALVALATRRADAFWSAIGYEPSATYLRKPLT